ncbi:MAG: hypothetical protein ACM3SP_18020 [Chloroflexota bacterium]
MTRDRARERDREIQMSTNKPTNTAFPAARPPKEPHSQISDLPSKAPYFALLDYRSILELKMNLEVEYESVK